ncbi:MAG TPA: CcoQ/FixQ family Cbb3-type cytochrome c oxidase assembly chaperone [Vulgatibacter sp.]|nr:CcoQ/FixQ family Cbb3-type cytochrome c oxidase assembly chaperone [Vulgatibacter sp.]
MFQEAYRGSELLHLPMFALFLFLAVFVGTLLWLFVFQRHSDRFARLARIPLDADADVASNRGTKE